jgi:hypothetical protein
MGKQPTSDARNEENLDEELDTSLKQHRSRKRPACRRVSERFLRFLPSPSSFITWTCLEFIMILSPTRAEPSPPSDAVGIVPDYRRQR